MRWRPLIWCVYCMSISRCGGVRSPDLPRRSCGMVLTRAPSLCPMTAKWVDGDRAGADGGEASVVVGVDAGGTSTRSVVVTLDGACLGLGRSGAANPVSSGIDRAMEAITSSVLTALGDVPAAAVEVVVLAAAGGANRPEVAGRLQAELAARGVNAPVELAADGFAAFCSGTADDAGCALVAGTGAVALRVSGGEVTRVADGLGWLLGDGGSGFWMGRRVVRAALAELDGRGEATALTPALLTALGMAERYPGSTVLGRSRIVADLLGRLYEEPTIALARFSGLAVQHPADAVAAGILADASRELAATLGAVLEPGSLGPVVMGGGLLAGSRELREGIVAALGDRLAGHSVVVVPDGLAGAAVIALRRAGVEVDDSVLGSVRRGLDR